VLFVRLLVFEQLLGVPREFEKLHALEAGSRTRACYLDRFWNEFSANPARFSEAAHELPSEPRVGTSDATAPGRIEIGPEETGSGPTWSPPFQWAAADFCSVNAPLTAAARV